MSSIRKATLHLQRAYFKFPHTFIICDRLQETDFLFDIDLLKQYSLSYCWDSDRHFCIQREGSILNYTRNQDDCTILQLSNLHCRFPLDTMVLYILGSKGVVYSTKWHCINNQHTKKGLKPNIQVPDGIYNIKRKINTICNGC